jgi:hypothetical protein
MSRIVTSYTPEDGHLGRNMQCETVTTYLYNKAACRRQHNLQNPLNRIVIVEQIYYGHKPINLKYFSCMLNIGCRKGSSTGFKIHTELLIQIKYMDYQIYYKVKVR